MNILVPLIGIVAITLLIYYVYILMKGEKQ